MKISDRTFIISGGASGLGRATAVDLIQHGGYVAVLDMNEELADELIAEVGKDKARFWRCDVAEPGSVKAAVEGALAWAKETGKEVGGVVAAAGVGLPAKILNRDLTPFSLDDFNFVVQINLQGTIDLVRQCLPALASNTPDGPDKEHGIVIMVASSAAFDGQPGQTAYAASKGAITAMTLPMTRDLARYGIRVVTIAPSMFKSRMTDALSDKVKESLFRTMEFPRRPGMPEEFAHTVRMCVENVMLNGTVIRLDGGVRMPSKM
ncbi:NAD(P)-binding protein [Ascodesmis nigricans]|uniref:NAD(P)-binding protein n=1 Tax=Ascodesmis nigricans TaxID=341454 RepID=A0A4S2MS04_9PEZI|nr:NAD(P)-binding protein [Ascodesmis nigricans]